MKIKSLTLKNFKSIGEQAQTIELKPITLLFGPNSVGKSTILQALAYLREVVVNDNPDAKVTTLGGQAMNLGGFDRLVHRRKGEKYAPQSRHIEIGISLDIENDFLNDYLSPVEQLFIESNIEGIGDVAGQLSSIKELHCKFVIGRPMPGAKVVVTELTINDKPIHTSNSPLAILVPGLTDVFPAAIKRFSPHFMSDEVLGDFYLMNYMNIVKEGWFHYVSGSISSYLGSTFEHRNGDCFDLDNLIENLPKAIQKQYKRELKILDDFAQHGEAEGEKEPISRIANDLNNKIYAHLDKGMAASDTEADPYAPQAPLGFRFNKQSSVIPPRGKRLEFDDNLWNEQLLNQVNSGDAQMMAQQLFWVSLVSGVVVGSLDLLRTALERTNYIGPLRMIPERGFTPALSVNPSWANGEAAWVELFKSRGTGSPTNNELIEKLNHWMGDGQLATGYQVAVENYTHVLTNNYLSQLLVKEGGTPKFENVEDRVVIYEAKSGIQVEPNEIGVGISQLLPVVVAALTHRSGVFSIEQPELHLHPRVQCELADLFISAKNDKTIWLLETHSEHLILRLMRRIRDKTVSKEDLGIYYVDPQDGGVRIKSLEIDNDGDLLDEWPGGFFEESFREKFAGR